MGSWFWSKIKRVTVDDDGLAGKIHKARGKGVHINCVFVCVCVLLFS